MIWKDHEPISVIGGILLVAGPLERGSTVLYQQWLQIAIAFATCNKLSSCTRCTFCLYQSCYWFSCKKLLIWRYFCEVLIPIEISNLAYHFDDGCIPSVHGNCYKQHSQIFIWNLQFLKIFTSSKLK